MTRCESNSDENLIKLYKIDVHHSQSRLSIGAEHCQTKRIYRTEIDQDAIVNMTQGACETCEHLFELLQELIDNDGKCSNKNLKILEQGTKVRLDVTVTLIFGRISRQFNMQFDLDCVRLDDISRLENIIHEYGQRLEQLEWSISDRFDHATKLISLWENEVQFRNLSSDDHAKFSDNNRTICCQTYTQKVQVQDTGRNAMFGGYNSKIEYIDKTYSHQVFASTNHGFLSKNKRYQSIRFNIHSSRFVSDATLSISIGIIYQPDFQMFSTFSSQNTWVLNIFDGSIQKSSEKSRPYTWPIKEFTLYQQPINKSIDVFHVDLLLDTHHRYLTFRVQDQTEDQWAFHLPKDLKLDLLYPYVSLNSTILSISIDF
ncbi:unnamed protein product [Rotaria sp. Silwood2]|nr:unnamed protein product [Rotaria sp. Silwood2]CAF4284486.1 unnamed protein product [Rotaria sp. Silwood2]